MRLIWTQEAVEDFRDIVEYLHVRNPEAAHRLATHIFKTIEGLPSMPHRGRPRYEDAGREIVFVPWKYVAVYEVVNQTLYVKAIRHISRAI